MNTALVQSTTFAVDDVEPATRSRPERPYAQVIAQTLQRQQNTPLESWSRDDKMLLEPGMETHGFLRAINIAFALHHPFVMSPDMIWFLILKGLATHIHLHAETLRSRFVAHADKALLVRNSG